MSLPALHKTWQGGTTPGGVDLVNQTIAAPGSAKGRSIQTLFDIKQALVSFDSNPWTVIACSDGVAFNHSGTDLWIDTGDIVDRAGPFGEITDPFSWIVLQQSGINAKFQVMFSLANYIVQDDDLNWIGVHVSPAAGFGAANGGSDGSLTSAPTATDSHTLRTGQTPDVWCGGSSSENTVLSCFSSTDGECTRIVGSRSSSGIPFFRMNFEKPRLPNPAWTNPCFYSTAQRGITTGIGIFQRPDWQENTADGELKATVIDYDSNPLQVDLLMLGPMWNTQEVVDRDEDTSIKFYAGSLHYPGTDAEQPWGTLFDWYWVTKDTGGAFFAVNLDTFPLAGDRTFVCVGGMINGWLDDSVTDLAYT